MKKLLLASASALLLATHANAADITTPTGYDWSGIFIGGQVGYGWGKTHFNFNVPGFEDSPGINGLMAGVNVGAQIQTNNLVFGVVGDLNVPNLSSSTETVIPAGDTWDQTASVRWAGSVRAKAGFVLSDSLVFYGTGGLAFGDVDHSLAVVNLAIPRNDWSSSRVGWTAGIGADYALTRSVAGFVEARYTDLGTEHFDAGGGYSPHDFSLNYWQVQTGITFQLGH